MSLELQDILLELGCGIAGAARTPAGGSRARARGRLRSGRARHRSVRRTRRRRRRPARGARGALHFRHGYGEERIAERHRSAPLVEKPLHERAVAQSSPRYRPSLSDRGWGHLPAACARFEHRGCTMHLLDEPQIAGRGRGPSWWRAPGSPSSSASRWRRSWRPGAPRPCRSDPSSSSRPTSGSKAPSPAVAWRPTCSSRRPA